MNTRHAPVPLHPPKNCILVSVDGQAITWVDGDIRTSKAANAAVIARKARMLAAIGEPVDHQSWKQPVIPVVDDPNNPVGALAAILAAAGGRGLVLEAPDSVNDELFIGPMEDDADV